jgi:hypothetical protein
MGFVLLFLSPLGIWNTTDLLTLGRYERSRSPVTTLPWNGTRGTPTWSRDNPSLDRFTTPCFLARSSPNMQPSWLGGKENMSILGDIPLSKGQKAFLLLCHFLMGAFFGLFPAILVFSGITIAPGTNYLGMISTLLLIFCAPSGLIFMILGLVGRGRIIAGICRLLGRHVDPNSM